MILVTAVLAGLVDLFMALMTVLIMRDLLSTAEGADEERAEKSITWALGLGFLGVTLVIAVVLFGLVRFYLHQRRHPLETV